MQILPARRSQLIGAAAFAVLVGAAFSQFVFSRRLDGEPWQVVVAFALGAVYLVLGVFCNDLACDRSRAAINTSYVTQCAIAATAILVSPALFLLAMPVVSESVFDALRAGAVGYLLKASSAEKLYGAVRAAAQGTSVLEPNIAARLLAGIDRAACSDTRRAASAAALPEPLSARELDVLRFLANGCSNKETGAQLHISEGTVKNHMTNVLGKLGALDRTQAALRAREPGLI